MIPLCIGPEEKQALLAMKAYARAHPLTLEQIQALGATNRAEPGPVVRHAPEQYTDLPVGFQVGLTYELQGLDCWHLSMSLNVPGRMPHPAAVDMVLEALGLPPLAERLAAQTYGEVINLWFLAAK